MQKPELFEIEWASPKETPPLVLSSEEPVEEYGPWEWAAASGPAIGRFGAEDFVEATKTANSAAQQGQACG